MRKIINTSTTSILSLFFLLLLAAPVKAQENNGVIALQETLDETKKEIESIEKKLPQFDMYAMMLNKYKKEVEGFDPEVVKSGMNWLKVNSNTNKKSAIDSVCNVIAEQIQKLVFTIERRNRTQADLEDIETRLSNAFSTTINKKTSGLAEKAGSYFLTDEEDIIPFAKGLLIELEKTENRSSFAELKKGIDEAITAELSNNELKRTEMQDLLKKKRAEKFSVISEMSGKDKEVNALSIKLGLPLFCITVILLFLAPYLYRRISPKAGEQDNSGELISKVMLEVTTVLLITMSVLILGLAKILHENVLGTLLGAIAGYILNRSRGSTSSSTP